jgi:hypothetical protein
LDSSLGYLGCPHPAEAGGVGRGAAAELQVVTLEEFLEVYDGYIGGKYLRGVGVFESLGYFACGPVGLIRTQKSHFSKTKDPVCTENLIRVDALMELSWPNDQFCSVSFWPSWPRHSSRSCGFRLRTRCFDIS